MRVLSGIPEIDHLEDELAQKAPALVASVDQAPTDVTALQISPKTRGLEKLVTYPSLRRVIARGVGDRELEQIGRITSLEHLELTDSKSASLAALPSLSRLRILSVSNAARLVSLEGAEKLTRLELLSASNTPRLGSIDAIRWLGNLRVLFIAGGLYRSIRIPSLHPLAGLEHLLKLVLSNVGVADRSLRPLAGLKNLRRLSLPLYFPAEEFAMLERALPEAMGDWRNLRQSFGHSHN